MALRTDVVVATDGTLVIPLHITTLKICPDLQTALTTTDGRTFTTEANVNTVMDRILNAQRRT